MNTYVIEWRYINTNYTEEKQTYIVRAVDIEQAVNKVRLHVGWDDDKETNSSFYGFNTGDMLESDIVVLGDAQTAL